MKLFGSKTDEYFDSDTRSYPALVRGFLAFAKGAVLAWSKIYWRWSVDGPNPYKPTPEGACGRIFVCNHASMLDPALLVGLSLRRGCAIRPIYKSELDESGFLAGFFARIGALPIKRGTADMKAIRRAVASLKRGENILVFPEGTRVWDPHERVELHGGFSIMAQMAGSDIVPIAIDGTELINPNKSHVLSRPSRVRVRFGEPIALADVPGESRKEKAAALESLAMDRVYAMREDLRREAGKA